MSDTNANNELVTDIDDVEGHGLKEFAIGLGTVGIVASGASTAIAMNAPSTDVRAPAIEQTVDQASNEQRQRRDTAKAAAAAWVADPMGKGDATTDYAITTARTVRGDAVTTLTTTVTTVDEAAAAGLEAAHKAALDAAAAADAAAAGALETAGSTLRDAHGTVQDKVTAVREGTDAALSDTKSTADGAVVTLQRTAADALDTTGDLAGSVRVGASVGPDGAKITAEAAGAKVEVHKS